MTTIELELAGTNAATASTSTTVKAKPPVSLTLLQHQNRSLSRKPEFREALTALLKATVTR